MRLSEAARRTVKDLAWAITFAVVIVATVFFLFPKWGTVSASSIVNSPTANQNYRSVVGFFDGGGAALSGTTTRCQQVNFGGTINEFSMVADQSGNATVTVLAISFGSYTGPGSAVDISNGGETMTGAVSKQDSTLTGWTTSLAANTVVCFSLSSPATITWLNANIRVTAN